MARFVGWMERSASANPRKNEHNDPLVDSGANGAPTSTLRERVGIARCVGWMELSAIHRTS